jgi:hypothetical protein
MLERNINAPNIQALSNSNWDADNVAIELIASLHQLKEVHPNNSGHDRVTPPRD